MSNRTSEIIEKGDQLLQQKRKAKGIETTPYNYDPTIDINQVGELVSTVSKEKISENADILVSNAPKANDKSKTSIEATTIDTSAISEPEITSQNLGVNNNDKEKDER